MKTERTHRALARAALELSRRQGFDRVTVDEIAHRAGASRTTFFRHFASKDEAILHHLDTSSAVLLQEAARALAIGPVWPALRSAAVASTRPVLLRPRALRTVLDVIEEHPALGAARAARAVGVRQDLVALVMAGSDDADVGVAAGLTARCALAVVDTATEDWRAGEQVDLVRTVVAGFERLAPSFA